MAITDEITRVIRERIQGFDGAATDATMTSVGTVIDGRGRHRARLRPRGRALPRTASSSRAPASSASPSTSKRTRSRCRFWATTPQLRENDEVRTTGRIISVPVGDALIGRVVNALGEPIDEAGPIATTKTRASRACRAGRHHTPPGEIRRCRPA